VNPEKSNLRIGVDVLPAIRKDTTDRNRTSPLAFTGNKFEFRMVGSSQSVASSNIALNTIMAEELGQFADILENAENFDEALHDLVCKTFTDHQRIIFDGNGYSEEWKQEAACRGLSNYPSTAECLAAYPARKNIDLVTRHGIFTEAEFMARHAIHLETYNKTVNIEARTMVDMAMHQILPAAMRYSSELTESALRKQNAGISAKTELALAARLSQHIDELYAACEKLNTDLTAVPETLQEAANYFRNVINTDMDLLRAEADALESLTDKHYWPYPTYSDLLFY